jgi:hypothetical protein
LVESSDRLKVYAGIVFLRRVEGQKHLVCYTTGFTSPVTFTTRLTGLWLDSREDDERLARRAVDAGIALDVIDPWGTDTGMLFSRMASRNAAEFSGGQFSSLRTADAQLARIDDLSRNFYVLGYAPANRQFDGTHRDVVVKVNRRDVTVFHPHGYTARPDAPPLDLKALMTRARFREAAATDLTQDDIKVRAQASPIGGDARQLRVDVTIDPANLTLARSGDRREGSIHLLIVCGDAKQQLVGSLSQEMALGMDTAHFAQAVAGGIPYTATIPVTGVPAFVKVLVYDYGADRLGSAVVRLK